ncbi:hypothetical protein CR513_05884, partial [Mucuna pruriens]
MPKCQILGYKKIFNKISSASTSKEAWEILVKTYGDGEKNKVKLQTLIRQYELLEMEDSESINSRTGQCNKSLQGEGYKSEVVDKIPRTLPLEFDYVAATIEESKDLDTIEVEELQHSFEMHEGK